MFRDRPVFSAINLLMAGVFVLSAAVQYNDPDPWVWIAVYGYAALACGFGLLTRANPWIPAGGALFALGWSLLLIPEFVAAADTFVALDVIRSVEMKTTGVELFREIGGLWIVVAWLSTLSVVTYRGERNNPSTKTTQQQ